MSRKPYELDMSSKALDLRKFTRDGDKLTTFASDHGAMRDGLWWLQSVYDDACDVGIAIRSHVSQRVVRFFLEREETKDGDLCAWHFKALDTDQPITTVTIFND